jgi:hypothetical protein
MTHLRKTPSNKKGATVMICPLVAVHLAFSFSIRDEGVSHNQIFKATPWPFVILNKH